MNEVIKDLKQRARILHRMAIAGDAGALGRLVKHKDLKPLGQSQLQAALKRRHCLSVVAQELGFESWRHLVHVVDGLDVDDYGTALHRASCYAHWSIWCASYTEAAAIRADHGGFLLPYKRQFLVVDEHYLRTLGLNPDAAEWASIGRDWVRPGDIAARTRLYGALFAST